MECDYRKEKYFNQYFQGYLKVTLFFKWYVRHKNHDFYQINRVAFMFDLKYCYYTYFFLK